MKETNQVAKKIQKRNPSIPLRPPFLSWASEGEGKVIFPTGEKIREIYNPKTHSQKKKPPTSPDVFNLFVFCILTKRIKHFTPPFKTTIDSKEN